MKFDCENLYRKSPKPPRFRTFLRRYLNRFAMLATAFNFDTMQRYPNERCNLIFPVFISRLTIFGYLTIATFEPTRTTTIFDTK